jgi:hypothetical protein
MENKPKICVNCKYYFNDIQEDCHYCTHEKNKITKVNLVTGNTNTTYIYQIENLRDVRGTSNSVCGDVGRWFVDKTNGEIY